MKRKLLSYCFGLAAAVTTGELLRPFRDGPETLVGKIAGLGDGADSAQTKRLIADFLALMPSKIASGAKIDPRLLEGVTELFRTNPSAAWALLESMELPDRLVFANKLCVARGGKVHMALEVLKRGWVTTASSPQMLENWTTNATVEGPAAYRDWTLQIMKTLPPGEVLKTITNLPIGSGKDSASYLGIMMDLADREGHQFGLRSQYSVAGVCREMCTEDFINNPQFLKGIFSGKSMGLGVVEVAVQRLSPELIAENLHMVTDQSKFNLLLSKLPLEALKSLDSASFPEEFRSRIEVDILHKQFEKAISSGDRAALQESIVKMGNKPNERYFSWLGAKVASESNDPASMLASIGRQSPEVRDGVTTKAMAFWAKQDVVNASAYLAAHPELGDAAVVGLLPQIADDPASAITWAMKIQEPGAREAWVASYLPALRAVAPERAEEIAKQLSIP